MTATYIRDIMRDLDEDLIAESEEIIRRIKKSNAYRRARFTAIIAAAVLLSMLLTVAGAFAVAKTGLLDFLDPRREQYLVENGKLLSYVGSAREITLPKGVTTLASDAFEGNKSLRIINLNDEVCEIEIGCFSSCPGLEEVRVPEGCAITSKDGLVISADGSALLFVNRSSLADTLSIPEGVSIIDASFYNCDTLEELILPSTLEIIADKTFANCSSLTDVELGGVISIGEAAFKNCNALISIDFGEAVSIGAEAFAGCRSLKYIDLCDVEIVYEEAFSRAGIEYANLGDSIITVSANAFSSCEKMVSIILPETVEFIHLDAFKECTVETVYYKGTEEMWEQIEVNGLKFITDLRIITNYGDNTQMGFVSNGDGTCIVTPSSNRSEEGVITIPATSPIGEIVVGIEPFKNRLGMTGIVLPATITNLPENAFAECYFLEQVSMPGVTEISKGAFMNCQRLEQIDLRSVNLIGDDAFKNCIRLYDLHLSDTLTEIGNSAFENCKFAGITLPSTVVKLGDSCFAGIEELEYANLSACSVVSITSVFDGCTSLSDVKLPETLREINENSFSNCKSLKSIDLPDGLLKIGTDAFAASGLESITVPDSVTSLHSPFTNAASLKEITLGDGLVTLDSIGEGCAVERINFGTGLKCVAVRAFANCKQIESLTLPETLTMLSSEAFSNCVSLKELTIPQGVTELPEYCFTGCTSLYRVTLPSSLTVIGAYSFNGCTALSSVNLPDSLSRIDQYAFNNCSSVTSLSLPDKITTISDSTFSGCTSLSTVKLPKNLKEIGNSAFADCSSLKTLDIPSSLQTIEDRAFFRCSSISSLVLPATLDTVNALAFAECAGLKSLTIESPEGITFGSSVFAVCSSLEKAVFKSSKHLVIPSGFLQNCYSLREIEISGPTYEVSKYSFSGCSSLKDAEFDKLISTDWYSFEKCTALEEIVFSDTLETVSMMAFSGCTSLKRVVCGRSMTGIESDAFLGCSSLEVLSINDGMKAIAHGAFEGTVIKDLYIPASVTSVESAFKASGVERVTVGAGTMRIAYSFEDCASLKEVVFEDADCITLQQWAFRGCKSLRSVIIEKGHLNVSSDCFDGCSALSNIDFSKIDSIGSEAFKGCVSLPAEIIFNNLIMYVGTNAFDGCTSIEKVVFGMNMLNTNLGIFRGCTSLKEVTLGPILAASLGGINIEKVYYRGTEENFERLLTSNGITFSQAETVFDVEIPLTKGFTYVGDTVNYTGKSFSAEAFTDPVAGTTEKPWDYRAGNMLGDDLYRLAKNDTHSIVYWSGVYYLVENTNLTEVP